MRAIPTIDVEWFARRTGYAPAADARAIAAVNARGVHGMVVFDHWTPASAQLHVALDSPIAGRALLTAAFDYLFNQCGRLVAIGITPTENANALRLNRHLGFRATHLVRDGWAKGVDLVVFELRRERWIEIEARRRARFTKEAA